MPPSVGDSNYPEDKELGANEDGGLFFDSLLSVKDMISQILDLPNT
jgi:hypothetical protein